MAGDLPSLAAKRFVATGSGCVYRQLFDTTFAEAGVAAPTLITEVGSIGTIAGLVAAGAGFGLVPRLAVVDALARGEIVEVPWPNGPAPSASLVLIWRRRRVQPPPLKLLLAAAGEAFTPVRSDDALPRHAASSPS